jgi:hypothetical protein
VARFEDDDRDRPPDRPPATSPVLIIALLVGGVLLLGAVACAGLGLVWFRAAEEVRQDEAAARAEAKSGPAAVVIDKAQHLYTREEFWQLVIGKTPDEVRAALGKPDEVKEDGDEVRWTYRGRIKDPEPGKAAPTPVVVFRDGKAAEVTY